MTDESPVGSLHEDRAEIRALRSRVADLEFACNENANQAKFFAERTRALTDGLAALVKAVEYAADLPEPCGWLTNKRQSDGQLTAYQAARELLDG